MITIQDLYNIVGNKIANEAQKTLIRNNFPPQIAEQMCNAIDGQERAEHFQRLLKEYNEWMQSRQRTLLEAEGVTFKPNGHVDMKRHLWEPDSFP